VRETCIDTLAAIEPSWLQVQPSEATVGKKPATNATTDPFYCRSFHSAIQMFPVRSPMPKMILSRPANNGGSTGRRTL
jgi:hypothetical protein